MIHSAKIAIVFIVIYGCTLLASINSISAQGLPDEQEVKISFVDIPLDSALLLLSSSSRVNISFDPGIIPQQKVSLNAHYLKLGLALDNVLVRTNLKYKIVGNQLVIVPKLLIPKPLRHKLSGYIRDATSGEALVYATVYTDEATYGITTNDYGFYSLEIPRGEYSVHYSYLGYQTQSLVLDLSADTTITVSLGTDNMLNEIVIIDEPVFRSKFAEASTDASLGLINSIPSLGGEADLLRMLQTQAGISSGPDGLGGISIRGSSPDQNLILYDGVPVYQTGHAFGLFSIFNPGMIKSSRLIKGGFPARYGGRVGSVLEVFTKEGNNQELHGDISVSPLSVRAVLEGPLAKNESSFIVSARRTIVDPWLKPLSRYQYERNGEQGFINFYFYDLNAKLNFQAGANDQLYVSAYMGQDRYANETLGRIDLNGETVIEELDESSLKWGNKIGVLRWNHIYGSKLFSNLNLSYSRYQFQDFDFKRSIINPDNELAVLGFTASLFDSDIEDIIGSLDYDYYLSRHWHIGFGVSGTMHSFRPGTDLSLTSNATLNEDLRLTPEMIKNAKEFSLYKGQELRSYIENEWAFGNTVTLNAGVHYSEIGTENSSYRSIQPRVALRFNFSDKTHLSLGYAEMDQFMHLLSTSGLGLPSDVWIPSTATIKPQYSKQFNAQLHFDLSKTLEVEISAYRRSVEGIRALREGALFNIQNGFDWQQTLPVGESRSTGFEFSIDKKIGNPRIWANYSYSKTMDEFASINSGVEFRARNDRRHMLNAGIVLSINGNLEFATSWTYRSGSPITLPIYFQPVAINNGIEIIPQYGPIHNAELPEYHRLDFGVNLFNKYSWGSQKLSIGAYNVYGRSNPFYVDIVRKKDDPGNLQLEQVSLFPFVPYLNFALAF